MDSGFIEFAVHYGYLGIFLWFLTIDNFTPIPQEISLLTVGYLSANGFFNPILVSVSCLVAFLGVDLIYFKLSNSGYKIIDRFFERNWWARRYAKKLESNMGKTLFTLCFLPRMRFISPILVGILNLSFKKFLFYNIISLIFFIFIYVTIGNVFHQTLHKYISQIDLGIFIVFMAALILFVVVGFQILTIDRRKKIHNMEKIPSD